MADIATLSEFASFLQTDVDTATASLVLLDLAQGLIVDEIGTQNPWPATAKAIALAAAARAYRNPQGLKRETVGAITAEYNAEDFGVYLTDSERARLFRMEGTGGGPLGSFPESCGWPDPIWG